MSFCFKNLNPQSKIVKDCVVRAIALATNESWDRTYIKLSVMGFFHKDVFTSNYIWGLYLLQNGFKKQILPNQCPDCYTVEQFCADHPSGIYVLAIGDHVVTAIDGTFYDTWQSGDLVVQYFFKKEGKE